MINTYNAYISKVFLFCLFLANMKEEALFATAFISNNDTYSTVSRNFFISRLMHKQFHYDMYVAYRSIGF